MEKRVIIGFGTGRCGTKTLAGFLDQQEHFSVNHEDSVPYDPQWNKYLINLTELFQREEPIVGNVSVAWISYIDRLVMDVPDLRIICLDRGDPSAVVASFHSYCKKADFTGETLYGAYPVKERTYSRAAVSRTVRYYLWLQKILLAEFPQILHVYTGGLNDEAVQKTILDHCGVPSEYHILGMPHLNKRKDMGKKRNG